MINGLNDKRWKLDEERAKLGEVSPCKAPFIFLRKRIFWSTLADSTLTVTGTVPDRAALARHKKVQKAEALELRHLQSALGFPLAPNVLGIGKKDIDDDLETAKKLIEEDLEALGVSFFPPFISCVCGSSTWF